MLQRRRIVFVALLLVASSCGGDEKPASPVTEPPSPDVATSLPGSSTTQPPPTTPQQPPPTTVPPPTTTPPDRPLQRLPILVANDDGVSVADMDGTITRLWSGPVAYAVDDTRGGLVFQIDRGRDWEGFFGTPVPGRSTVVWWIPAGESAPRELLVPTPGQGHDLTLHDTFAVGESFAVVYQRHEGTQPPFDGDMRDTLRVYDVASGTSTELFDVRGWEWNLTDVSAAGGLIVATEQQILGAGCRVFEAAGRQVTPLGIPTATDACFAESDSCPTKCTLAGDAESVVYMEWVQTAGDDQAATFEVRDTASGQLLFGYDLELPAGWGPTDLDISGGTLLVNRTFYEGLDESDRTALIIDLADPESAPTELPIPGTARFATGALQLGRRDTDSLNYYVFGKTGLVKSADGVETTLVDIPVVGVWDDQMGGVLFESLDGTTQWLKVRTTEPITLSDLGLEDEWLAPGRPQFTGVADRRPMVFYPGFLGPGAGACDEWQLIGQDLVTGDVIGFMCLPIEDAWFGIRSVGDGTFVGDMKVASGSSSTSRDLRFWDISGQPLEEINNPFPDACEPCELSAMISPDGTLLAYSFRPDAKWPPRQWDDVPTDEWWEYSKTIGAHLVVIDLETGRTTWQTEAPAGLSLDDFDGHWLVARSGWGEDAASTIYDTLGEEPPIVVAGEVRLVHDALPAASLLTLNPDGMSPFVFGDAMTEVMPALEAVLGPPTREQYIPGFEYHDRLWEAFGLYVRFTNSSPYRSDGTEHFAGWGYWSLGEPVLTTDAGVTVGDTYEELSEAHTGELLAAAHEDECRIGWYAMVESPSGGDGMLVVLDGTTTPGKITSLEAGQSLGC